MIQLFLLTKIRKLRTLLKRWRIKRKHIPSHTNRTDSLQFSPRNQSAANFLPGILPFHHLFPSFNHEEMPINWTEEFGVLVLGEVLTAVAELFPLSLPMSCVCKAGSDVCCHANSMPGFQKHSSCILFSLGVCQSVIQFLDISLVLWHEWGVLRDGNTLLAAQ